MIWEFYDMELRMAGKDSRELALRRRQRAIGVVRFNRLRIMDHSSGADEELRLLLSVWANDTKMRKGRLHYFLWWYGTIRVLIVVLDMSRHSHSLPPLQRRRSYFWSTGTWDPESTQAFRSAHWRQDIIFGPCWYWYMVWAEAGPALLA
jgi:hypothetical protein